MNCAKCGTELPDDAEFCLTCGLAAPKHPPLTKARALAAIIKYGLLLLVLFVLIWAVRKARMSSM